MKYILIFILLLFGACATKQHSMTIASTREVKVSNLNLNNLTKNHVDEKVCNGCPQGFLAYYTAAGYPSTNQVLEEVLKKGNGDLLLDGEIYYQNWGVFVCCTRIEGDVVNTKERK